MTEDICTCAYDGPDEFGNYDLMVSEDCPLHAGVHPADYGIFASSENAE